MLKCDWKRIDGERCRAEPRFLCNKSHVLCRTHAIVIKLEGKRRNTDRQCVVCASRAMMDFWSDSDPKMRQRRRSDNQQTVAAAEGEVANQIVKRFRERDRVC